jgi:hypothetical protein
MRENEYLTKRSRERAANQAVSENEARRAPLLGIVNNARINC